jgi:hypothetical protein
MQLEAVAFNSFIPEIKEIAGAVCIWKPLAKSQDGFAIEGLAFLKKWAGKSKVKNRNLSDVRCRMTDVCLCIIT